MTPPCKLPASDGTLRVAFAGAGRMAMAHLHAMQRVTTAHAVVAVHDATPEAAQAFAARTGATPYPTLGAMLREARPDIVHVCTPPETHFAVASEALQGGAHVYV